jgi:hypothetical protein
MFTTTKITLSAAIILGTAFSASAATKPRVSPNEQIAIRHSSHKQLVHRQSGLGAFALVPQAPAGSADDPALTGGGSVGYNAGLRTNRW